MMSVDDRVNRLLPVKIAPMDYSIVNDYKYTYIARDSQPDYVILKEGNLS